MTISSISKNSSRVQDIKNGVNQEGDFKTCLKFEITPQITGLLENEFAQEVLAIKANNIMPVPNKPSCILGILTRHRRVYWAIDLSMLLGLQPLDPNIRLYEVILTKVKERSLALVVPSILGVIRIPKSHIKTDIFTMPEILSPYLDGYLNENGEISYLFQAENILRSSILHS